MDLWHVVSDLNASSVNDNQSPNSLINQGTGAFLKAVTLSIDMQ